MGHKSGNTFSKALKHLKSTQIDEKISLMNESPTNNTSNLYALEPDRIEIDPNGSTTPPDFTADDPELNGRDTSGLFEEDGTIKVIEPPGDTSYILGPMSEMWYAWGNFTQIGYIRQSDRRMVNLARISGPIDSWNGTSNFTSYGQLTLEQAQWFKDTYRLQYRAFYPGPPSNVPDEFGRYYCTTTGTPKGPRITRIPGAKGGPEQAGYPWGLPPGVADDMLKGGKTASPLGDLGILGLTAAAVKGALALGIGGLLKGLGLVNIGAQVKPLFGDANNASDYNKQLAGKLVSSILSGLPEEIKLTNAAKADQIQNVNPEQFRDALTFGTAPKPSAESTINPGNKRPVFTGGWGAQGGSEVHYDQKTDTLTFTSEKTLRTGQPGDKFDSSGRQTSFGDIPSPSQQKVESITKDLLGNGIIDNLLGGLGNVMRPSTGGQNAWDQIKSNPTLRDTFVNNLSTTANNIATGGVQGTASNTVALRDALTNLGIPKSAVEKTGGGYGQVFSQTSYSGNQIPPELRDIINKKSSGYSITNQKPISTGGFKTVKEETKVKKILREVKKPVVVKEVQQEKIKRRPKVIGAPPKTINSDLMKQAEVPTSFKPAEERVWGKYERRQNERMSQNKKNVVLDHLGASDHAWEYLLERNRSKDKYSGFFDKDGTPYTITRKEELNGENLLFIADETGKKESLMQSELNDKLDYQFNKELFEKYFSEQETLQADKEPLFKKVSKVLKKEIDYTDKPSKLGYPNENPPEMIGGYHPDLVDGEKISQRYNKLDPISANSMPPTGNIHIDSKVQKAKKLKPVKSVLPDS
jgi:hypothetical protein